MCVLVPILSVYLCVGTLIYRTAHLPMFAGEDHHQMTRGRKAVETKEFRAFFSSHQQINDVIHTYIP